MIDLTDIRWVRLGTKDRAAVDRCARQIVGLALARDEGGALYYRSDARDHTPVYFEGDPANQTVGFELADADADALDAADTLLSDADISVRHETSDERQQRCVRAFLNLSDLSGNRIDLVVNPHHSGKRHFPSRDAGIPDCRRHRRDHRRAQPHVRLRSAQAVTASDHQGSRLEAGLRAAPAPVAGRFVSGLWPQRIRCRVGRCRQQTNLPHLPALGNAQTDWLKRPAALPGHRLPAPDRPRS